MAAKAALKQNFVLAGEIRTVGRRVDAAHRAMAGMPAEVVEQSLQAAGLDGFRP